MDKYALIAKINQIEGLTDEERAALREMLTTQKKYGLVWEEKTEEVEERLRTELPVLKEVADKAIISQHAEAPNHILIEGDNLEALTALSYTHAGKIDVIYIDPPYNTGNKDFVYNDSFVDHEDNYRHSKWLSFMNKRLKIAKQLLSDRGVIFISIDDNEQAQLKLLCDEIFGGENYVGPIIQDKQNAKNDTINIQKNHEFILCYRKHTIIIKGQNIAPSIIIKKETKKKVLQDEEGKYFFLNDAITTRGEGGTLNARPNLGYTFYYNENSKDLIPKVDYNIELAKTSNDVSIVYQTDEDLILRGYVAIRPPQVRGKLGCWTWDISKAIKEKNLLYVKKGKNNFAIHKRTFVPSDLVKEEDGELFYEQITESNSRSIIPFSTNAGTAVFKEIMGSNSFNNPKNLDMIKYLLSCAVCSNTILDFFAGSGTTLHATMQLNAEDGGRRQCILVTNNENGICENVTYERNRRVIEGYTTPKGDSVAGLSDNSLRYYRTALLPRRPSMKNKRLLMEAATELLCIKHNVYRETNMLGGRRLSPKAARYFDNGREHLLIVYKEETVDAVAEALRTTEIEGRVRIYVFSINSYAYEDRFSEVADRVELCALPAAIYEAYKHVLPRKPTEQ